MMNATKNKNEKKLYYILSGVGRTGCWNVVYTTLRGLKLIISKYRKHGWSWCVVCEQCCDDVHYVCELGSNRWRLIPDEIYKFGQDLLKNKKNK